MARGKQSDHIVLKDRSGANKTGLKLLRDSDGRLQYGWELARSLAPNVPQQDVSYAEVPAEQELVWSQHDWSGGGLRFYHNPADPRRYAFADGVWAATPNELALGPVPRSVPYGIPNGGAEMGATTNWSVSGCTISAVTTAPKEGIYHFQLASMSANDYAAVSLTNVARLAGVAIAVTGWVRDAASSGGAVRIQIVESGGSSTPTTSGTAITLSTTYQQMFAEVTLQGDTTGVQLRFEMSTGGGSGTVYLDWTQMVTVLSSSEILNQFNARLKRMGNDLFSATRNGVWKLNETNDFFELQESFSNDITGFEVFDDQLFVGQGNTTVAVYQYSAASDATSWTAASGAGGFARYFQKTLNAEGNWAMAKTLNNDEVYLTTTPKTGTSWGAAVDVGKDDFAIRQIYNLDSFLGIGKEDGFYVYEVLDGNRFTNRFAEAELFSSSSNFSRGTMYHGYFFTIAGETGLLRFDGQYWQNMGFLLQSPGFEQFGGRALALGTDGQYLYAIVGDLIASSVVTKTMWLMAIHEVEQGVWATHPMANWVGREALDITVHKSSGADNRHLYIPTMMVGDNHDFAAVFRMTLPSNTNTPRLSTDQENTLSGTFVTSWWDGNRPQVEKSFNKFTLLSEDLSGNLHVTVAYEADDDGAFTNINSSDSIFNTSPSETISANAGITFRRIRFRFTLTTNALTTSPVIKGFVAHFSWRPSRLKQWTLVAEVERNMRNLQGVRNPLPPAKMLSQLSTLKDEVSPITMEDIDGVEQTCHIVEMEEGQYLVRRDTAGVVHYARGVSIRLVEAKTS